MTPVLDVRPTPSPDEAAAIAAAVQAVLGASAGAPADPRPAAYRSAWRRAAIREGVGLAPDQMRSR